MVLDMFLFTQSQASTAPVPHVKTSGWTDGMKLNVGAIYFSFIQITKTRICKDMWRLQQAK